MVARVLVVDDEEHIRRVLDHYLRSEGFDVVEAACGHDALERLGDDADPIHLVLLDIGLPGLTGLEVLARIRATSEIPVIIITARSEEVDTLVGFSVGADDYVTKPFSPREVAARVRSVLRRAGGTAGGMADPVLRFEGITIDPRTREVLVDGQPVTLTALEFDLLHAMASDAGRVFSRAQLLEQVWGYDFYGDERIVDVHIRSIRAALCDDAASPRFVGTVRRVGYQFLGRRRA